jgi:hypothetical protein
MKSTKSMIAMIMAMSVALVMTSCGGSKNTTSARGDKQEKEECEQMALDASSKTLRASGQGISQKESFAKNLAANNARNELARMLEVLITGAIRAFDEQNGLTPVDTGDKQEEATYYKQFLANTKIICNNTYVKDGSYNVYVCVEMSTDQTSAIHKRLSADKKIQIDFDEQKFRQEYEKELEKAYGK